MHDRSQLTLEILIVVFFLVLLILGIALARGGRGPETAAVIREVRKVASNVEGLRQQNSAEHGALEGDTQEVKRGMRQLLERFGFLRK